MCCIWLSAVWWLCLSLLLHGFCAVSPSLTWTFGHCQAKTYAKIDGWVFPPASVQKSQVPSLKKKTQGKKNYKNNKRSGYHLDLVSFFSCVAAARNQSSQFEDAPLLIQPLLYRLLFGTVTPFLFSFLRSIVRNHAALSLSGSFRLRPGPPEQGTNKLFEK